MKKLSLKLASIILSVILFGSLNSCMEEALTSPYHGSDSNYEGLYQELNDISCIAQDMEISELTDEEAAELIFMREEEKLARDVYLTLFDKWGQNTFKNIAKSEQQHTDAIKMLIEKYSLTDPVTNDDRGEFENEELLALYNTLISQGDISLIDALRVGAAIEEIDILDLDEAIEITDNEDINIVYENLRIGSENHLNAFVKALSRKGYDYTPQYLSQELFDEIIK